MNPFKEKEIPGWKQGRATAPTFSITFTRLIDGKRCTVFEKGKHYNGTFHHNGTWEYVYDGEFSTDDNYFSSAKEACEYCEDEFEISFPL